MKISSSENHFWFRRVTLLWQCHFLAGDPRGPSIFSKVCLTVPRGFEEIQQFQFHTVQRDSKCLTLLETINHFLPSKKFRKVLYFTACMMGLRLGTFLNLRDLFLLNLLPHLSRFFWIIWVFPEKLKTKIEILCTQFIALHRTPPWPPISVIFCTYVCTIFRKLYIRLAFCTQPDHISVQKMIDLANFSCLGGK